MDLIPRHRRAPTANGKGPMIRSSSFLRVGIWYICYLKCEKYIGFTCILAATRVGQHLCHQPPHWTWRTCQAFNISGRFWSRRRCIRSIEGLMPGSWLTVLGAVNFGLAKYSLSSEALKFWTLSSLVEKWFLRICFEPRMLLHTLRRRLPSFFNVL